MIKLSMENSMNGRVRERPHKIKKNSILKRKKHRKLAYCKIIEYKVQMTNCAGISDPKQT